MNILALIPARGGSKSVPNKNIKLLAGKPLIAYAIEGARKVKLIDRIIVSTDSIEIAEIAMKFGAEIPFIRPDKFAQDKTPDLPVFKHTLRQLKEKENYVPDIIVHLRPTAPLRKAEHITEGIKILLKNKKADSVRSVCEPGQNPYKMWKKKNNQLIPILRLSKNSGTEAYNLPRQKLPRIYWQNASVDVIRYETIMRLNSMSGKVIVPLIMDEKYSIDLDTEFDFTIAEQIILTGANNV